MIKKDLTYKEKGFLISIKEGIPRWELLEIDGIENLPGLQWKLLNIKKMSKEKRAKELEKLEKALAMS